MQTQRKAFTLIELLVVIAIIAILAAILFPVFAAAKQAAKKASDLSNVNQAIKAQLMYCADNDDRFPGNTIIDGQNGNENIYYGWNLPLGFRDPSYDGYALWPNAIDTYLKERNLLTCPVDETPKNWEWSYNGQAGCPRISYFMNAGLMGASQTQVPDTSKMMMYRGHRFAHRLPFANPHFYLACGGGFAEWTNSNPDDGLDKTFGNGHNVGWVDGHTSWREKMTLTWYEIGETNTDPKIKVPDDIYYCMSQPWRGRPVEWVRY